MNNDKNFLTFENEDGSESVYELIEKAHRLSAVGENLLSVA